MREHHIASAPKHGRELACDEYRASLGGMFGKLCSYKGVEIVEGRLMPGHVHMLPAIPPECSASGSMGYLEGESALMMFGRRADLKYRFGNRRFRSEGRCVPAVGLNEATVARCIGGRESHDRALDELGVKECEDPSKRGWPL